MWIRWLHAIAIRNVEFLAFSSRSPSSSLSSFFSGFFCRLYASQNNQKMVFYCSAAAVAVVGKFDAPNACEKRNETKTWRGTLSQIFIWCGRFRRYHRRCLPHLSLSPMPLLLLFLYVLRWNAIGFNSIFNENWNYLVWSSMNFSASSIT